MDTLNHLDLSHEKSKDLLITFKIVLTYVNLRLGRKKWLEMDTFSGVKKSEYTVESSLSTSQFSHIAEVDKKRGRI